MTDEAGPGRSVLRTARVNSRSCGVLLAAALLAGCTVFPSPLKDAERERLAAESREQLFAGQEAVSGPLTLYEATARAIKYQSDYRIRLMEQAAALGQLGVAQFDMLPKLTMNAGYSTRSNDAFGFGFTPSGQIATNPTASVERTHNTGSIGFTWSILDFGVSYFRAKQLADQSLVAGERRRKAVQNLVQDVRLVWWRAEAAQRLLPAIDVLFEDIDQAIEKTRIIESRKLLPPLQTAALRRALLDLQQQISLRRQDLAQAQVELAALVNLPPGAEVKVAVPDREPANMLDLTANGEALEAMALRNRPELAEEAYKARINESETKKALLALFPNVNLDEARNFDSNRFLVNNTWNSTGVGIAFNLVKVFSAPAMGRSATAQRQLDQARQLAMAMAIMTQTRIAIVRYGLLAHEFEVWDEATRDDDQIVKFLSSSAEAGVDTELELMRAKARYYVSKVNRDLVYANLEAALARIFNSVGLDALPTELESRQTAELARELQSRLEAWQKANFTPRPAPEPVPVAVSEIAGVPAGVDREFRSALDQILSLSKVTVVGESDAKLRVLAAVTLEPLRNGGRPATVRVRLLDAKSGAVRFASEFRTTLSEPIDAEQWRTLGEGVAYRVAGPIARLQARRAPPAGRAQAPELGLKTAWVLDETRRPARDAPELGLKAAWILDEARPAAVSAPTESPVDSGPLDLRLDADFDLPGVEHLSRADSTHASETP